MKTNRKQKTLQQRRADETRRASRDRCSELVRHHLKRALDETFPQLMRELQGLSRRREAGGRRLGHWLGVGALKVSMADRVRPAIEGLYGLGHTALAKQFDAEFTNWEARCDALAASCPRALPADKKARNQLIASKVAGAEALLTSLVTRIGHYADAAGADLKLGPEFAQTMKGLLSFNLSSRAAPPPAPRPEPIARRDSRERGPRRRP